MNDDAQSHPQCAWCTRPVPDVAEVMTAVHAAEGVTLVTCGAGCLAELVAALTGTANVGSRHHERV
jgi:hypothetical protein